MDRRMTDELREKMLGIMPFTSDGRIDYTPPQYDVLPEEWRPVFELRSFSEGERRAFERVLSKSRGKPSKDTVSDGIRTLEEMFECARPCVTDIRNLFDVGTNAPIEFKAADDGGVDKDLFAMIPRDVRKDVLDQVGKISGLIPQEKLGLES